MSACYVIQDHSVHIPRGQLLALSALHPSRWPIRRSTRYLLAEDGGCHELSDGKPTWTAGSASDRGLEAARNMNDGENGHACSSWSSASHSDLLEEVLLIDQDRPVRHMVDLYWLAEVSLG